MKKLNRDWLKRDKYGKRYGARYMPEQGRRIEIDGQYEVEHEMRVVKADCPHCDGQVVFGLDGCAETTWLVFQRCDCAQNKVHMVIRVSNPDAVVRSGLWPTARGTVWPAQADDSFLGKFVKAVTQ